MISEVCNLAFEDRLTRCDLSNMGKGRIRRGLKEEYEKEAILSHKVFKINTEAEPHDTSTSYIKNLEPCRRDFSVQG